MDIRERTAFTNVTMNRNQGNAAFLVKDGAADIWLNDTRYAIPELFLNICNVVR